MRVLCQEHTSERSPLVPSEIATAGTLDRCHSLAAVLACWVNDRYLFSVSVVARANAGTGELAGGSRLLDLQRGSTRRRHVFSADQ